MTESGINNPTKSITFFTNLILTILIKILNQSETKKSRGVLLNEESISDTD
jgi:hypothetical protein